MLARLSRIVLMVRPGEGLAKATEFYHQGLGLTVVRATDDWTELSMTIPTNGIAATIANIDGTTTTSTEGTTASTATSATTTIADTTNAVTISLQVVHSEAQVTTGYSPLLQFLVDDMDATIAKCVQLGGQMDGPIQYPAHGKVAALRSPDGHMIGLYEPSQPS